MTQKINEFLQDVDIPIIEGRVHKETFGDGRIIYTPQVRETKFLGGFFNPWKQIVKIYDEYIEYHFPGQHNLTFEDCEEHIKGYQEQFRKEFLERNSKVTVQKIDLEKEVNESNRQESTIHD